MHHAGGFKWVHAWSDVARWLQMSTHGQNGLQPQLCVRIMTWHTERPFDWESLSCVTNHTALDCPTCRSELVNVITPPLIQQM